MAKTKPKKRAPAKSPPKPASPAPASAAAQAERERADKLERLVVLVVREIDRILFDVHFRREILFKLWSKERIRLPLLRTLHSRYRDLGFDLLILLPNDVYQLVDDFYRQLDEFVFYVSYTEDMPQTLSQKFLAYLDDLERLARPLVERLCALVPEIPIELAAFEPPTPPLAED